jgi:hypothetical protein
VEQREPQSPGKVELQTQARFGKRAGASEYAWQMGEENVPPDLIGVCDALARISANSGSFISLVAESGGSVWLVRLFREGVDDMFRAIAAIELSVVVAPSQLPLEHWLGLAVVSLQSVERERIGESLRFTINVPPAQAAPEPPNDNILARAFLGLPVSTSFRVALSLLSLRPWRYRGVCFALSGRADHLLTWVDELSPYLCVNFAEPLLSDEELMDLQAALSRPISASERSCLLNIDAGSARAVLRWSLRAISPFPYTDSSLIDWLKVFRSSQFHGAELLATFRRDVTQPHLPPELINEATRSLSLEAASFIRSVARGEPVEASLEIVEELGQQGFLDMEEFAPLRLWAKYARESAVVAEMAINRFVRQGVEQQAAEFVLNLNSRDETQWNILMAHLAPAVRIAIKHGLPAPRQRLAQALSVTNNPAQLGVLREIGSIYGGDADALAHLVLEGTVPASNLLTHEEILAALRIRQQVLQAPHAFLSVIAGLLKSDRKEHAIALWQAAQQTALFELSPAGRKIVEAHLGLIPPVQAPVSPDELKLLVHLGLAEPEDVLPDPLDSSSLVNYARAWSGTRSLAQIIEGSVEVASELPVFPAAWKPAVKEAVTPLRALRWLQRVKSSQLRDARHWLANLHGFNTLFDEILCSGETISVSTPELPEILRWLPVIAASSSRAEQLRGLLDLAKSDLAKNNDASAAAIVSALLPQCNEQAYSFAVYALSRVGPFPPLEGVPPDLIINLMPVLDVISLVNGIFAGHDTSLSKELIVIRSIVERLSKNGSALPAHGYTLAQRQRHLPLTKALAQIPGWQSLAPDAASRAQYLKDLLQQLDLDLCELQTPTNQPAPEQVAGTMKSPEEDL